MPAIVPIGVPVWLAAAAVTVAGEVDCDTVDADTAAVAVEDAVDKLVVLLAAKAEEDVVVTIAATALLILK